MSDAQFNIEWIDSGSEPTQKPNPDYPKGIDLDGTRPGQKGCRTPLPYPAKRCGYFIIQCLTCHYRIAVTTAGRPDDPRSVRLPCKA
jgi:hypothetical protein